MQSIQWSILQPQLYTLPISTLFNELYTLLHTNISGRGDNKLTRGQPLFNPSGEQPLSAASALPSTPSTQH